MISYWNWRQRLRASAPSSGRLIVLLGITIVMLASLGCGSTSEVTASVDDPAQPAATSVAATTTAATTTTTTTADTDAVASTGDSVAGSEATVEPGSSTTLSDVDSVTERGSERQQPDYVWVDFVALQSGRSWTEITADGEATFVRFGLPGTSDLAEVKTGALSSTETDQAFSILNEIGFLDMGSINPADQGEIYEGDILVVAAQLQGQENLATFRPPDHVPASIETMVAEVEGLVSNLEPESGPIFYVRSEAIGPSRLEWLEEKNTTFVNVDNVTLADNYPSLAESKVSTGRMVTLAPDERLAIASGISEETSIFVSTLDGPFQFEIFALEP